MTQTLGSNPVNASRAGIHRIPWLANHLLSVWFAVILGITVSCNPVRVKADELLVFAAASQREALDAVIDAFERETDIKVKAAYQSSSALARQIEQGAPADVYISANSEWMDYLGERKLIDASTRTDLFGNGLVLVAAKDGKTSRVDLVKGFDLAGLVGGGRLAVGDPDHVPAGIYAKQAMRSLGMWESMESRLARAENVRAALALVSRGEAPYGIVYASDAKADDSVRAVATFPADSHAKIVYPVAVTAAAKNTHGARRFLEFLVKPEAVKIYQRYGFRVLVSATN